MRIWGRCDGRRLGGGGDLGRSVEPSGIVGKVDEVVGEAHEPVFDVDLLFAPEEEPSEASVLLDLSEDRFGFAHALSSQLDALRGVQTVPDSLFEG